MRRSCFIESLRTFLLLGVISLLSGCGSDTSEPAEVTMSFGFEEVETRVVPDGIQATFRFSVINYDEHTLKVHAFAWGKHPKASSIGVWPADVKARKAPWASASTAPSSQPYDALKPELEPIDYRKTHLLEVPPKWSEKFTGEILIPNKWGQPPPDKPPHSVEIFLSLYTPSGGVVHVRHPYHFKQQVNGMDEQKGR